MSKKIDITSTALEKGIDIAKDFLDKLIIPAVEETGLLIKEKVTYWKFKNQVKMLNKAQKYCEANGITPKAVSLKLLCPLLDNAALEEQEMLQDKWAILLSNLVDSEQNIENHVFPYILGQLSTNEFLIVEKVYNEKRNRIKRLTNELEEFVSNKPQIEKELTEKRNKYQSKIDEIRKGEKRYHYSDEVWELQKKKRELESEIRSLNWKENRIKIGISQAESVPQESLREFELSNLMRLGLIKFVQETYADSQTLEIPNDPDKSYLTVDLDFELESNEDYILTELGELFIEACKEKKEKTGHNKV